MSRYSIGLILTLGGSDVDNVELVGRGVHRRHNFHVLTFKLLCLVLDILAHLTFLTICKGQEDLESYNHKFSDTKKRILCLR